MPVAAWVYGVLLAVAGSVCDNLGNNLVSLGHKDHKDKTTAKAVGDLSMNTEVSEQVVEDQKYFSWFNWCMIGRVVFVSGSLFTFASFAFAAQSLIASLDSIQFVSNVVFLHFVHHEVITTRMLLATASIVIGNVLVVLFSDHHAQVVTSDDMIELYKTNYIYHGYMVLAFFTWCFTAWQFEVYHHARIIKRELLWNHSFVEPLCYAVSASIVGTQAVLNSKCLALLLDSTTRGEKDEFQYWYLYFMLGTWLVLVLYWLVRLDHGLSLFPPVFIIPVMQAFFLIFAILCGGIYLEEFVNFSAAQCAGFTAGVVLILAGVYGLAPVGMTLHVPGDPAASTPVKIAASCSSGVVHTESVLTDKERDLENAEMDMELQAILSLKPQPEPHTGVNLFSASVQLAAGEESVAPAFDTSSTSTTSAQTVAASKKSRRVVKRPLNAETVTLPPLQVRGSVEHCDLVQGTCIATTSPRGSLSQCEGDSGVPAAPLVGVAGALALVHDAWKATGASPEHDLSPRRGSADLGASPRGLVQAPLCPV